MPEAVGKRNFPVADSPAAMPIMLSLDTTVKCGREMLLEKESSYGFHQVSIKNDNAAILPGQVYQSPAVNIPHQLIFRHMILANTTLMDLPSLDEIISTACSALAIASAICPQ